jgi:hypothetical protein
MEVSWIITLSRDLAMRCSSLVLLLLAAGAEIAAAQPAPNAYPVKPVPLADSAEISLALSAAPSEVSALATVYAVRDGKVLTLRRGSSGAACMVGRDSHAGSLYPICFNAEGARTALARELMEVKLRSLGVAEDSIVRAVDAAYARGELTTPREMALAYMMSPRQVLFSSPGPEGRRVGAWHPHLMLYVPNATPAMFALEDNGAGEPIAVGSAGTPRAEVIVKLPKWADGTPAGG